MAFRVMADPVVSVLMPVRNGERFIGEAIASVLAQSLAAFELVVVLFLVVLNGLFAMSELALVSVRRARLVVMERAGARGATTARILSEDPQRFLPTVQVGITLVSVLAGVFGGAHITARLEDWLLAVHRPRCLKATSPTVSDAMPSMTLPPVSP